MDNWRCSHGWLRGEQCEICNAPKREWVGLTDEDCLAALISVDSLTARLPIGFKLFARAIETKLKERNT